MHISSLILATLLGIAIPSTAIADPVTDGIVAYATGNYAEALRLLRPLAAQGEEAAQDTLGDMYANGEGVAKDSAEALHWYRLSAAKRDAPAQFSLGRMYENGEGVTQDKIEALRWYRLAADEADKDGDEITARDATEGVKRLTQDK